MKVGELNDEAMARIAARTRELMIQRKGEGITEWILKHPENVEALARCTWIATREEMERQ
jgi:hypothetical protein